MITIPMIIQLLIVLLALYVGSRYGSLALGAVSILGLAILVMGFGMEPGKPPTEVIYIIMSAVTCAGILQAAGGMDWLIQVEERLLRKNPERITFIAPLCTFFLTVFVGTGHVVYTLMPIIADVSIKNGIRPERPCAVASVASQVAIAGSPLTAAMVAFLVISNENGFYVTIPQILIVTTPACLLGVLAASLASYHRGLNLDKDPEFQKRIQDPTQYAYIYGSSTTTLNKKIGKDAKRAVYIFIGALVAVILIAIFQNIFAGYNAIPKVQSMNSLAMPLHIANKSSFLSSVTNSTFFKLKISVILEIIMVSASALMIIFCKTDPKKAVSGTVWRSGMVAVIAIFGIAWLSDTYFSNYMNELQNMLGGIVIEHKWTIALVFFFMSVLINSQCAVVVTMIPIAYKLGIPGPVLLGVLPSIYGYFVIPNYPSDIATVNFDRTGTTVIGKYIIDNSFMMPGMISVIVATATGYFLSSILY